MSDVNKIEALLILALDQNSNRIADSLLEAKDKEIEELRGLVAELADALALFWHHYPPRRDTPMLLDLAAIHTSPGVYPAPPFTGTN